MIAAIDVDYAVATATARAACVRFADWRDAAELDARVVTVPLAAAYVPGELYRRELPAVVAALRGFADDADVIVVDGYVWLTGVGAGLGAHLHEARGRRGAVIGVAKTTWSRPALPDEPAAWRAVDVMRGDSTRPLHVTAVGIAPDVAAARVAEMHGPYRLPTLLKRADTLARGR